MGRCREVPGGGKGRPVGPWREGGGLMGACRVDGGQGWGPESWGSWRGCGVKARVCQKISSAHQALHHDLLAPSDSCPSPSSFPIGQPQPPGLLALPWTSCSSPSHRPSDSGPHRFSVALLARSQLRSRLYLGLLGSRGSSGRAGTTCDPPIPGSSESAVDKVADTTIV